MDGWTNLERANSCRRIVRDHAKKSVVLSHRRRDAMVIGACVGHRTTWLRNIRSRRGMFLQCVRIARNADRCTS